MMFYKQLQKNFLWFLILYIAIIGLFVLLVDYPLLGKIKAASNDYLDNQKVLASLAKRGETAQSLQENYQASEEDLNNIKNSFLRIEDTVGFIADLEKIASQTNNTIEIKSVSPFNQPDTESKCLFLGFRINIYGSFSGLMNFLASLEDSPYPPYRLTEIESVDIARMGDISSAKENVSFSPGDLRSILGVKIYTK